MTKLWNNSPLAKINIDFLQCFWKTGFPHSNRAEDREPSVSCGYRLQDITDVHIMARLQEASKFDSLLLRIKCTLTEAVLWWKSMSLQVWDKTMFPHLPTPQPEAPSHQLWFHPSHPKTAIGVCLGSLAHLAWTLMQDSPYLQQSQSRAVRVPNCLDFTSRSHSLSCLNWLRNKVCTGFLSCYQRGE